MQAEHQLYRPGGFILSSQSLTAPPLPKNRHKDSKTADSFSKASSCVKAAGCACKEYSKTASKSILYKIISVTVAICCVMVFFKFFTFSTAIFQNGERLAVVSSPQILENAVKRARQTALSYGISDEAPDFFTAYTLSLKSSLLPENELFNTLLVQTGKFSKGCTAYAENIPIFTAKNKEEAKRTVDSFISQYSMNGEAALSKKLTYKDSVVPLNNILSKEQCLTLLAESKEISVVSVVNSMQAKVLPFETQTQNDDSLYIGERLVVTEGINGSSEVTEQTVYENGYEKSSIVKEEKITVSPVNQVVKIGTKFKKVLVGGLIYPLKGALSSPFGERWGKMHEGIDIAVAEGTPVKAAECGTVSYVSENAGGYGKFVRIDHGYGVQTAYAHLSEIQVYEGQAISAGEIIALSGNTGKSTGPHLHFEITQNDIPLNPLNYLKE